MGTTFFSIQYESLLLLGLVIMAVFLLIIVTFSWFHQKKKGKEENKEYTAQSDYQRKLNEIRIEHEEKARFGFARDLQAEIDQLQFVIRNLDRVSSGIHESETRMHVNEITEKLDKLRRRLEHVTQQITPALLMEAGLSRALELLVLQYNKEGKADLYLVEKGYKKQADLVEVGLYRIAEEIISNALKHGKPNRIDIQLKATDEQIVLEIWDNGLPFDLKKRLADKTITDVGNGLKMIESRLHNNAQISYIHLEGANRNTIVCTIEEKDSE